LFLIAALGEVIVGTAMGGFDGHRRWVYYLAVASEHRRKGFARDLMAALETRLLEYGCTKLNLQVRATNQDVVDFYLGLGHTIEDRVSMGKRIQTT
jgi:ribosomal protein S18 acetylase RimI-like enzyme